MKLKFKKKNKKINQKTMLKNSNRKTSLNFYKLFKKIFDFLFSLLFLIISLPLFILISLFIKLSSRGPIFYLQERIGKNNIPFRCIKFRTMHPEAKDILENLLIKDDKLKKEFEETHKLKNDPRITIIGKFLRKTSLDELPQLINVLKKEMSIVGPRPLPKNIENKIKKSIKIKRRKILPGITGMSQINYTGKNRRLSEKVKLDIKFIDNYSLNNYFKILIKTPIIVFIRFFRNKSSIIK